MKKLKQFFLSGLALCFLGTAQAGMITPNPVPPNVAATAYILQDHDSGHVLAAENPDERLPAASITKLMTSYVVSQELESGNIALDDDVLISEKAWRMVGSRSFIEVNTRVPVEALLRGMIVQSGNDAAVALAEHVAGSEETFAQMMNQYAARLGMTNTNYTNSTGLPDENQYTTARDISTLSSAMIRDFPEHYEWYAEKEYTYNDITQHNRNKLLWRDNTVDGLKTGHTEEAGYCLAASAKRDDQRLIAVVLGTRSENARTQEIQKLFNYGYRFFETHELYEAGETVTENRIWKGDKKQVALSLAEPVYVTVPRGRYKDLEAITEIQEPVIAPVQAGEKLGQVEIRLDDELITRHELVAAELVEAGPWWRRWLDALILLIWG